MDGTSGDVFCEWLVRRKPGIKNYAIVFLGSLVAALGTAAVFLYMPTFLIAAVALWFGVYYLVRFQKIEFEYTFTSGDLDIDQLSGDIKRKRKLELSKDDIEMVAPEKSESLDVYKNGKFKLYDFSKNIPQSKDRYVIIGKIKNERIKVVFEPNEKLLDNMWRYAPSKVKRV